MILSRTILFVIIYIFLYISNIRAAGIYPDIPNNPNKSGPTYQFILTREYDSHIRKMIVKVNGLSPGPTIHANFGDYITVNVINQIYDDSTAIHWHGLDFDSMPWMDGVINVTQCPIPNVKTSGIDSNGGKLKKKLN